MSEMKNRIYVIDYIKALAIVAVIYLHTAISGDSMLLIAGPLWLGVPVPFFMALTGYTFSMSYFNGGAIIRSKI